MPNLLRLAACVAALFAVAASAGAKPADKSKAEKAAPEVDGAPVIAGRGVAPLSFLPNFLKPSVPAPSHAAVPDPGAFVAAYLAVHEAKSGKTEKADPDPIPGPQDIVRMAAMETASLRVSGLDGADLSYPAAAEPSACFPRPGGVRFEIKPPAGVKAVVLAFEISGAGKSIDVYQDDTYLKTVAPKDGLFYVVLKPYAKTLRLKLATPKDGAAWCFVRASLTPLAAPAN